MKNQLITSEQYKRACQLVTSSGYLRAFYKSLDKFDSRFEAYCVIENEYFQYFGEYRYSSFENFNKAFVGYIKGVKDVE